MFLVSEPLAQAPEAALADVGAVHEAVADQGTLQTAGFLSFVCSTFLLCELKEKLLWPGNSDDRGCQERNSVRTRSMAET